MSTFTLPAQAKTLNTMPLSATQRAFVTNPNGTTFNKKRKSVEASSNGIDQNLTTPTKYRKVTEQRSVALYPPTATAFKDSPKDSKSPRTTLKTAPIYVFNREDTVFELPKYSLAHAGTHSPVMRHATHEDSHYSELRAVMSKENGKYVCGIAMVFEGTDTWCAGECTISDEHTDIDVASAFQRNKKCHPSDTTSIFDIERKVPGRRRFTDLYGEVRLGRVVGEDADTYTCEATFNLTDEPIVWHAQVHVPKKLVPEYKLTDWRGERATLVQSSFPETVGPDDVVQSIETVSQEQLEHEEKVSKTCTVEFSERISITNSKMTMLVDAWVPNNGMRYRECKSEITIKSRAPNTVRLQFTVELDDGTLYFEGTVNPRLNHGRFVVSDSPPNPIEEFVELSV